MKRCLRCREFYENDGDECWYHPGTFVNPNLIRNGALVGWSCCRYDQTNYVKKSALERESKGCVLGGRHEEDVELTEMIRIAQGSITPTIDALHSPTNNLGKQKEKEITIEPIGEYDFELEKDEDELSYLEHKVDPSDSLYKISLHYGVSVEAIRKANRISAFNNFIHHHPILRIPKQEGVFVPSAFPPVNESHQRQQLIKKFLEAVRSKATDFEAAYYLESSNWDLISAINLWRSEVEWEKNNPQIDPSGNETDHLLLSTEISKQRNCC